MLSLLSSKVCLSRYHVKTLLVCSFENLLFFINSSFTLMGCHQTGFWLSTLLNKYLFLFISVTTKSSSYHLKKGKILENHQIRSMLMSSKGMKINRRVNPTSRLNFLTITNRVKPFLLEMRSTIQEEEEVVLWQEESA